MLSELLKVTRAVSSCAGGRSPRLLSLLYKIGRHQLCYLGEFLLRVAAAVIRPNTSPGEPLPLYCPDTGGKWQRIHLVLNKCALSRKQYTALCFHHNVDRSELQARGSGFSICWLRDRWPLRSPKSMPSSSLNLSLWFSEKIMSFPTGLVKA